MIIVEGTDKSGKTTFISNFLRNLRKKTNKEYFVQHYGLLPRDWNYEEDYYQSIKENMILDRFIDSEIVYGKVYRGGCNPKLSNKNLNRVYRKCNEMGCFLYYCNPTEDAVQSRIEQQGDEMIKKQEQLIKLRNEFDTLFYENHPLKVTRINSSDPISNKVFEDLISEYLMIQNKRQILQSFGLRGFITPYSRIIIYTNNIDLDMMNFLVQDYCSIPFRELAIVASRNRENKPTYIKHLISELQVTSPVLTFSKQANEDYKSINDYPEVYCKNYVDLLTVLRSI
ncbi:MAG: hypothetical protein ACOCV1_03585 [Bacillota bacterium]